MLNFSNKKIILGVGALVLGTVSLLGYRILSLQDRLKSIGGDTKNAVSEISFQAQPGFLSSKFFMETLVLDQGANPLRFKYVGTIDHGFWYILTGNLTGEADVFLKEGDTLGVKPFARSSFKIASNNDILETGSITLDPKTFGENTISYTNQLLDHFSVFNTKVSIDKLSVGPQVYTQGFTLSMNVSKSNLAKNHIELSADQLTVGSLKLNGLTSYAGIVKESNSANFVDMVYALKVKNVESPLSNIKSGGADISLRVRKIAEVPLYAAYSAIKNPAIYQSDEEYTRVVHARIQEILAIGPTLDIEKFNFSYNKFDSFNLSSKIVLPPITSFKDPTWSDRITVSAHLETKGSIAKFLTGLEPDAFGTKELSAIDWNVAYANNAVTVNEAPATSAQLIFLSKTVPAVPGFFMGIAQSVLSNTTPNKLEGESN